MALMVQDEARRFCRPWINIFKWLPHGYPPLPQCSHCDSPVTMSRPKQLCLHYGVLVPLAPNKGPMVQTKFARRLSVR